MSKENGLTKIEPLLPLLDPKGRGGQLITFLERDILLLESEIMGTQFIKDFKNLEEKLKEGEELFLFREPKNKYDKFAVVIKNQKGEKLGYLPKKENTVIANLLDAGKFIFAILCKKGKLPYRAQLEIKVYMKD